MKRLSYILISILIILFSSYVYKISNYTHIKAKFEELRPYHETLPVYYKGIIIGKGKEAKHSDDYKHTIITLTLYPKNLLLPLNSTVLLKKEKRDKKERDFLEIIYPKEPSKKMLANGNEIIGKSSVDIDTFMSNQHPDDIEAIKTNLLQSSENLNNTMEGLNLLFGMLNEILEQNQNNLYKQLRIYQKQQKT